MLAMMSGPEEKAVFVKHSQMKSLHKTKDLSDAHYQ